jgi:three-Cys-motif partner protein
LLPGSPQILIDAVRDAERAANLGRRKPLRIEAEHIFIEKKKKVADYLENVLRKRGDVPADDGPIQLLRGTFQSRLDEVIAKIQRRGRAHRAIFVLDQYGYTDVPAYLLKRIFEQLPKAEVFLTLAVGWITAYLPTLLTAASKLGIHPDVVRDLQTSGEGALDTSNPTKRPNLLAVQRLLHHEFTSDIGNRFYTPFFIVSRESNRPYWLLHLANNSRANDVVKSLHWQVGNHFEHYGSEGLLMLGFDPAAEPNPNQICFAFDDDAKARTHQALLRQLPERIRAGWGESVKFGTLFESTCNETPATRDLLARAISDLCVSRELVKEGAGAERRATTLPHDDDLISITRQRRIVFP